MRKSLVIAIALRASADATTAGIALAAGFGLCWGVAWLREDLLAAYFWQAPLLAVLLVGSNALLGVYTPGPSSGRRSRYRALIAAVSLAFAVWLLGSLLGGWKGDPVRPRLLASAYGLTLAGVCGSRWTRSCFRHRFRLERLERRVERPVRQVLVVGGAGYIGSGLVRDLLSDGYRVRVLDSLACGDESIRALYTCPDFEMCEGDFRHVEPVVRATRGMDAVIHLGAIVGDPACAVDEDETLETNLVATRLLAEVARASGVTRILFASTCSVYGACGGTVDERSALDPLSLYAATKIDSERVLLAARDHRFHPVVLRLATAFGWSFRPRFDLVVNLLAAQAAVEGKIRIFNGGQWRPFIHIRDISTAFRSALAAPLEVTSGEIFNAGSNSLNLTLRQLADQMAGVMPGLAVEYTDNADRRSYRVSFDKIRERLGFECHTSIETGIREIREALLRGAVADFRDPRYSNLQLRERLRRQSARFQGARSGEDVELTALKFAPHSRWWRSEAAAASARLLLQATAKAASRP